MGICNAYLALNHEVSLAAQEVEKAFFRQAFGTIARCRVDRLKLLCRVLSDEDGRKLLTVNILTLTEKRKEIILSEPPGPNYGAELYWLEQDAKAMLRLDHK